MNILIQHGRLIDPKNDIDDVLDISIVNGKIAAIGPDTKNTAADQIIDAQGQYVMPGIVDLCARLREPGEEQKATIASETAAAVSGGITRLICPPDTWPVIDTPAMAIMVRDRAAACGLAKVHPLGALTVGLNGEKLTDMAMLTDAGCVGMSNALNVVENTLVMRRAMQYASTYNIPVFLASQDPWLLGNGVVHEGEVSTRLGLPAIPQAAETVGVARDLALMETSGANAHISLISSGRSVGMIREAQQYGLPVTASVAIHQLLLCEDDIGAFDTRYKVFPPLRSGHDRSVLLEGISSNTISVICSDHQPHGADAKLAPFIEAAAGIAGLDTLASLALNIVNETSISLSTIVAALTCNPASVIGVDAGHLGIGAAADVCIFDPNKQWLFDSTTMISQGQNSPFLGSTLSGKVTKTLIDGKVVFG